MFSKEHIRLVKNVKLRDIAAAANVSLTTVSLVLNNKKGVGDAKRAEIMKLLEENGYAPRAERHYDPQRSICFIRCITHGHHINGNPGFTTQILDAAAQRCREHGYSLQVITLQREPEGPCRLTEYLQCSAIQGALVLGTELGPEDAALLATIRKPLVVVDHLLPSYNLNCITMNNRDSILEAMDYLYALGHKQVGFLYSSIPAFNDFHRRRAYVYGLEQRNISLQEDLIYPVFPSMDGACRSVRELLAKGVRFPTALLANNDSIAIGAMRAFREVGLRIPEDISIVGFDGLPFSAVSDPPLSTIAVPCAEIGHMAVEMLLNAIGNPSALKLKIMASTELVIRSSTAAPDPGANYNRYLL